MKTEEEIRENLKQMKKELDSTRNLYQMSLGYIEALEWVLESKEE